MTENIKSLVEYIVTQFAEDKENVSVTVEERDDAINIVVTASEGDMGRIIGKQGRIAKSMRTIVKSLTAHEEKKYFIEIRDKVAPEGAEGAADADLDALSDEE